MIFSAANAAINMKRLHIPQQDSVLTAGTSLRKEKTSARIAGAGLGNNDKTVDARNTV